MQEVADRAVEEPVVEVADAARENEADRDMRRAHANEGAAREQRDRGDGRNHREHDEELAALLPDAEDRAVVEHEAVVEQVPRQRRDAAVERHIERRVVEDSLALEFDRIARDLTECPVLRPEIERETHGEDADQRAPRGGRPPGRELAGVDRHRGIGERRTATHGVALGLGGGVLWLDGHDASVERSPRAPRGTSQRPPAASAMRSASMEYFAHGFASRRALVICFPVIWQTP